MRRARVLLADDHPLVVEACRALLEAKCEIVDTVTDGRALLDAAERLRPEIIVTDISMPRLNGLDAGRQLRKTMGQAKLIFVTANDDPELAKEALRFGASGYVLKASAASELFQAIEAVLKGGVYVTPLVAQGMLEALLDDGSAKKASDQLTSRQREVLQLLAEGLSMKEAAAVLNVAPRTIAFHKYRMMEELRIRTSAQLVQFAVREGIVSA